MSALEESKGINQLKQKCASKLYKNCHPRVGGDLFGWIHACAGMTLTLKLTPLNVQSKTCCEHLRGFSLIELVIVVAIISMVLVFLLPSYKTLISNTEDNIMSSQLLRAIHLAQAEAMMRQEHITLKKLSGGWDQGYEISIDGKTLHRFLNPKHTGQWHWRAFPVHRDDLQFLKTGVSRSENGTFWYCEKNNSKPRWAIVLNQAGRARVVYPNKEGEIENVHPLIC